ncbi:hypothetical protein E5358_00310 [Palleniella muris]|uniref:Uncharacterized protein n=1 Tax=Palleniella muris TaxID=3038145 RepID=A0AC61QTV9_9BACT|nr:phosphoethanolamine transferase [Palleniella muris]TGX84117.1 hypothetical protein E5358_00310 [Palleniella muris]
MRNRLRWLDIITAPIARNPEFLVFMFALGITAALLSVDYAHKAKPYEYAWEELFFCLYAVCAVLAVLPRRLRAVARGLVYAVAYPVTIVDMYCFVKFDATLNPSILMLVNETDPREAGEFFSAYLSPDVLMTNVGWVLLIPILHILWSIHRKLRKPSRLIGLERKAADGIKRVRPLWNVLVAVCVLVSGIHCFPNLRNLQSLMSQKTVGGIEHRLTEKDCGKQYLPLYRFAFSAYANYLASKQIDIIKDVAKTVTVDSCDYTSPNIVLIIGEAYCKRHSGLYGYHLPTTPRQVAMAKRGELVAYSDVVTPWNLTSYVFKHIMSTYTVGDKGEWCDYPLFGEVFRKAGYHVTFLTNEFLPKAKQAVYDFSGGFFLNDPEMSAAQFDARNDRVHIFDEGLLDDYKAVQERRAHDGDTLQKGNLTIFHLIGQHQNYRVRCPKSKKHFTLEDYSDREDLRPKWKKNVRDYDNATLYNDSIVREIVRLFENTNSVVIYMPDHGEEVHSRELPHFSGRMHSTTITERLAREEFEIPFWIWASKSYRKSHPELWKAIRASADRPYMTDALPHLLMYLAGIKCKYYRDDLNLLSPEYNASRPRILKHQTDYDVIMKRKQHPQPGDNPSIRQ